ncbi:MAG: enoyl-CoA hydratase/isomerase family protein [Betaproteobacteria bacterium]|nr:enoyl-CoA hydratase/isomerase family protein [Betaproteobacteria bacterium]
MQSDNIIVEKGKGVATVTLDRAAQMNPLDGSTVKALLAAWRDLEAEKSLRVVLITGSGGAFSAGGDLAGYMTLYRRPEDFRRFLDDLGTLLDLLEKSDKVIIAAVNGYCLAGGLELMLACDLAIAADTAQIGDAHLNFGQLPGGGGSQRLPRAIGAQRAKDLIFTGRFISGAEAERIGLVARVVPASELMPTARKLADDILAKSPAGVARAKKLVRDGMTMDLARALQFEIDLVHEWATTHPDAMDGLAAFAEKRAPRFGRP